MRGTSASAVHHPLEHGHCRRPESAPCATRRPPRPCGSPSRRLPASTSAVSPRRALKPGSAGRGGRSCRGPLPANVDDPAHRPVVLEDPATARARPCRAPCAPWRRLSTMRNRHQSSQQAAREHCAACPSTAPCRAQCRAGGATCSFAALQGRQPAPEIADGLVQIRQHETEPHRLASQFNDGSQFGRAAASEPLGHVPTLGRR